MSCIKQNLNTRKESDIMEIKSIKDDSLFAIIDFVHDTDIALDIADNFIKYFEGKIKKILIFYLLYF